MPPFRFGLEKVLDHRRRLVDLRSRDLAAAESRAAALAARSVDLRARQERCEAADAGTGQLDVARLAARTAWVARLDVMIAAVERERAAAAAAAAAARAALQQAWRDREVLDQLRARRQAEWQLGESRRLTAEMDEIGGRRHGRGARTGLAG